VLDMQAGAAAQDRERFANARAEWAWAMRERLECGDVDLDPADDDLAAQLGALKYRYNSRGQIVIESKDEMRKRGLPSPDRADAAILTAVAPAGADLFRRVAWRYWSWATSPAGERAVACADRTWPLASMWVFASAQLAFGEDAAVDRSVASVWGRTPDGGLVLLDRARERTDDGNPLDLAARLAGLWPVDSTFVTRQQHAALARSGLLAPELHLSALDADTDPITRALPASAAVTEGRVWLPTAAPWREQWTAECLAFPHARADGSVTCLALAVLAAATRWVPLAPKPVATSGELDPLAGAFGSRPVDFLNASL